MIKFVIDNLQAIKHAEIEIENNTITEFTGANSNGKSIITKTIRALTSGDIRQKEERLTLITDDCEAGSLYIRYNTRALAVLISRELKDSFVLYDPDVNDESKRSIVHLNDKSYEILVNRFGFRTYANGDICLQLRPTWGPIPFVTTSGSVNNDIVHDITTDKVADEFLSSFANITYPLFKERIKAQQSIVDKYSTILNNMQQYDWKRYGELHFKMKAVYDSISAYKYVDLKQLNVPPLNSVVDIPMVRLKELPVVKFSPYVAGLSDFKDILRELSEIINGVCPTCGRPLIEHRDGDFHD